MPPAEFKARSAARKRVLVGGKIVYGDGGVFTTDCVIRDISETGARVSLGKRVSIPSQVHFIDLKAGMAFEAEVVWRQTPNFGLHFVKTIDLARAPREFAHLTRLWNASSLRQ